MFTIDFYKYDADNASQGKSNFTTLEQIKAPHSRFTKKLFDIIKLNADYYSTIYPHQHVYFLVYGDQGCIGKPVLYGSSFYTDNFNQFCMSRWSKQAGEYHREGGETAHV